MGVVLPLVESVGGALVFPGLAATGREWAKVLQKSPASQTSLARTLVSVKTTACIQKTRQAVHQTVHQIARAMATGMRITDRILRFTVAQLGHHLPHRFRPSALLTPRAECRHPLAELAGRRRPVHLPHALVQLAGLAATVTSLASVAKVP